MVERAAVALEPGALHLLDDLGSGEDVALDRVCDGRVPSCQPTRPGHALRPGMRRGALASDDPDLSVLPAVIGRDGRGERRGDVGPVAQCVEQLGAVRVTGHRLRGDGTDTGADLGDDRADGEELARDGDAEGVPVAGDDGEGHGAHPRTAR